MLSIGKNHRIKSEFRFTVFLLTCIILILLIGNVFFNFNPAISLTEKHYETVEISFGDTLWEIASEYAPEDMDIRRAVYKLQELNNLSAVDLVPGMVIKIPNFQSYSITNNRLIYTGVKGQGIKIKSLIWRIRAFNISIL